MGNLKPKDDNDENGMELRGPIINIVLVIIVLVGIGLIANSVVTGLGNKTITVEHKGLPSEIELVGVPDNLKVVGIPDNLEGQIEVSGIPDNITVSGLDDLKLEENIDLSVEFQGFENLGRWIENRTIVIENVENGDYSISFPA